MSGLKIGVVGATGMVGRQYLEILEQSALEIAELRLYASARSVGSRMTFAGDSLPVEEFTVEAARGLDIALFSVEHRAGAPVRASGRRERYAGDRR